MTKDDLKSGMIITCRNGYSFVILHNIAYFGIVPDSKELTIGISSRDNGGWISFKNYTNDLTNTLDKGFDIMQVSCCDHPLDICWFCTGMKPINYKTIWTRCEKKKYTYEQLKEILGEEFEIVKE